MSLWIFGYGSLMWRPAFPHTERHIGTIQGWARRFWQGSPDHRGVPGAPGRVVTLVPASGARCLGVAYRVEAEGTEREAILAQLDHREIAGYERVIAPFAFADPARDAATSIDVLVYIAGPANPDYLGPAPLGAMAEHVCSSTGPSGSNSEYVLELAGALRDAGHRDQDRDQDRDRDRDRDRDQDRDRSDEDEHTFALEKRVRDLLKSGTPRFS
jgi:glutathione-specific gamma-glutamylcyclotransferase